jgi:hypothetical protein
MLNGPVSIKENFHVKFLRFALNLVVLKNVHQEFMHRNNKFPGNEKQNIRLKFHIRRNIQSVHPLHSRNIPRQIISEPEQNLSLSVTFHTKVFARTMAAILFIETARM